MCSVTHEAACLTISSISARIRGSPPVKAILVMPILQSREMVSFQGDAQAHDDRSLVVVTRSVPLPPIPVSD